MVARNTKKGQTMAAQKMTNAATPKPKAEKVHLIPMSQIQVGDADHPDVFQNSRTGDWHLSHNESDDKHINSLLDLIHSIRAKGQQTPVTIRPAKNPTKKQPYELVAGFRRIAAFYCLAHGYNDRNTDGSVKAVPGTGEDYEVKAFVRELNDYEARAHNIEENTARDDLTGPDLAWAIYELSQQAIKEGLELSDVKLAEDQGISQAYGNRLLRIMRKVDPKITADWRKSSPVTLTVPQMDTLTDEKLVADKQLQREAYEKMKAAKNKGNDDDGPSRGPGSWVKTAQAQAEKFGMWLALAESYGLIDISNLKYESELVDTLADAGLIKYGKEPTDNQKGKIADAIQKGYETTPEESDEPVAEAAPAPKKRKGKQTRKSANSAVADAE